MTFSTVKQPSSAVIRQACELLEAGQLVAFPTETVYGLGADALNPAAVAKLYSAKGRPTNHPVILHLAHLDQLRDWCIDVPSEAFSLAEAFWPGPLTMVLKRSARASDAITGGQNTVAIRIPNHPIALALLEEFNSGLIAPSANRFGKVSPTRAEHVARQFNEEVALILDGGDCDVGIESTIVHLGSDKIEILRPGMINARQIADCLAIADPATLGRSSSDVRVSGDLPSHYAPKAPVRLLSFGEIEEQLLTKADKKFAVISFRSKPPNVQAASLAKWVEAPSLPDGYAKQLYASLQEIDLSDATEILIEEAPSDVSWQGINDRLKRASADK